MCTSSFYSRIRSWIRPLLILGYLLYVVIVIPLLIVNTVKDGFKQKDQLVLIGGLFVAGALPISFWHISQHITHFTKPQLQKHIVRILWMVPIYAANAWLGLIFPSHSIYMDSIRECYEAYVIYNFMKYLLNYLYLEMDLEATMVSKAPVKHFFPLCCLREWEMESFIHNCKHGILQYTVVRPITTFIAVICELNGVYGEGEFRWGSAYLYVIFINNVSQFCAMYCLFLFYKVNLPELRPMRPFPKFLCIKAVIFFSFFQGVLITFLVYFGFIKDVFGDAEPPGEESKFLSIKLQNFIICIEMFLAALAHQFSFPHEPFHINIPNFDYDTRRNGWLRAFLTMMDISDVTQDVGDHIGVVGSSLSRRLRGRHTYHMARGRVGGESEYLVPTPLGYQAQSGPKAGSSGSRYGATESKNVNIRTPQVPKDDGFVNANYYSINYPPTVAALMQSSQTGSDVTTSESTSENPARGVRRSESNTTDRFDDDDFIEINVKGKGPDHINFRNT